MFALNCSNVCELSDDGEAQFERIWNSGNLNSRNVTLRSDERKRLHVPLYDLGMRGRVCIVPRVELQSLIIDASSAAMSLESFWGTVVAEFYDPHEAIDMLSILLYGPWGCFDVPEAVVEFVDDGDTRTVSELQLWGQELPSPALSDRTASADDPDYLPGLSGSPACSGDKLESLELTPKSRKWFVAPEMATRELGLDCEMSFQEFSELPPERRFAAEMWNSPSSQLPQVQWTGEQSGLKDPLTQCTNPVHFFMLFWPSSVLVQIVRMTNLYAASSNAEGGTKGGQKWRPLVISELLTFFGVLMLMSLKRVPHQRLHWSKGLDLFRTPAISDAMSRIRFESIIRCIHLVDNKDVVIDKDNPEYSKIAKTEWLVNALNDLCAQFWNAEQNMCVDEMMIKYTGKYSPIRQYMKAKPTQYGIKFFCLANSISKYVQKIQIYCGASDTQEKSGTVGTRTVLSLLEGYEGKGHIVTCDNFFTSPSLFWELMKNNILATGTVRTNRKGWPDALTMAAAGGERGQLWYRMHASNRMCAVTWYDNKPVSLLSTACSPIDCSKSLFVDRWHVTSTIQIPSSPVLVHYQKHMRGVDVQDQLRSYYSVQRRDHKWWHKILWHVVDQTFLNSFTLYVTAMKERGLKPLSHLAFNLSVAYALTKMRMVKRTCMPKAKVRNPSGLHYSAQWSGHGNRKRRACVVCTKVQQFYCPTCQEAMCLGKCYVKHHSNLPEHQNIEVPDLPKSCGGRPIKRPQRS